MERETLIEKLRELCPYGHRDFYEYIVDLAMLHSKKNYQYATKGDPLSNFKRCGALASKILKPDNKELAIALCYLSKQVDGVYEMVGENKTGTVEEIKDKLFDIACYAIICIILEEEGKKVKN